MMNCEICTPSAEEDGVLLSRFVLHLNSVIDQNTKKNFFRQTNLSQSYEQTLEFGYISMVHVIKQFANSTCATRLKRECNATTCTICNKVYKKHRILCEHKGAKHTVEQKSTRVS